MTCPGELVPRTEDEGYAVQDAVLTWHKENENDEIGGYKAGMVSYRNREVMGGTEAVGFDNPVIAGIRKSTIYRDQAIMKQTEYCAPAGKAQRAHRHRGRPPGRERVRRTHRRGHACRRRALHAGQRA